MDRPEIETSTGEVLTDPVSAGNSTATSAARVSLESSPICDSASGRLQTWEELAPKVRLRVEHAGKWVAWSRDGETVVASAAFLKDFLGHSGFPDHFTARFNGRAKTLTLTPNGTAPPPT